MNTDKNTIAKIEELKGAHDQTMRCEMISALFAEDAKRLNVTETEAFRLWMLEHLANTEQHPAARDAAKIEPHNESVKADELKLGDIVRLENLGAFHDCIVTNIANGFVHLRRPYMINSDFTYTGGVLTYIGTEDFCIVIGDPRHVLRVQRSNLKEGK